MIKRIIGDFSYVWIDVAYYDQEDSVIKSEEIGKQAAIFRTVDRVIIWLSPISTKTLERYLHGKRVVKAQSRFLLMIELLVTGRTGSVAAPALWNGSSQILGSRHYGRYRRHTCTKMYSHYHAQP